MVNRKRTSSLRLRTAGLAALGLVLASTLVPAAAAAADPPGRVPPAAPGGPPRGVTSQTTATAPSPPPAGSGPKLTLRSKDSGRSGTQNEGAFSCSLFVSVSPYTYGYDGFLEEVASVLYSGSIDCDAQLQSISGDVGLFDRSPAYNGESFSGRMLADAGIVDYAYSGSGGGQATVQARYYNGGRFVEPIMSLSATAPIGMVWGPCQPGFLTFIYSCSGDGSPWLSVVIGGRIQSPGLAPACRDQLVPLDPEEARLAQPPGPTPSSTQILNTITTIRDRVTAFKRDLCSVTSSASASSFAASQGEQLWTVAVSEAKNPARQNDDRPLYWARLSMTAALQQFKPSSFVADNATLKRTLDRAARGMNSSNFVLNTAKKVFVTGFDPFDFTGTGLGVGNPSAAAVLRLDNTLVNNAEVQVVIFPVRYREFGEGIVEAAVTSHVQAGPQQATLITTVSQGRTGFDLEVWNGRNRSSGGVPDNRDDQTPGTFLNPVEPPNLSTAEQFTKSSLPLDRMLVGSSFTVAANTFVYEQATAGSTPQGQAAGPTLCPPPINPPHPCYRAVEGGGGGFLSNEVAYRVTALRDSLGSSVQAGHVHTPVLTTPGFPPDPARRNAIVQQYRQILEAAIG